MIKKLCAWLLKECPMLGQVIKTSYNSSAAPKAEPRTGYWIGTTVCDALVVDVHEQLIFTESEFKRVVDRLYVNDVIPELLPAGYGVPHTTRCINDAGAIIHEEDRIVLMVRINWVGHYLLMTDTEFRKARDRGRKNRLIPRIRWWHKPIMKLVNRFPSLRPDFRPYDWSKRITLQNKLRDRKAKKGR